jgi:AcrR family transcriptional regulator
MQLMRDLAVTPPRRTRKSDETRTRILEVALELFRERGFEATTMRDIARACEIALGATYYHFASKEAIVLAFYELAKDEMSGPLDETANGAKNLQQGLRAVLDIKFTYFAPNRKFLGALFPHAADHQDPLSPFSDQNRPIRLADQECFRRLLASTKTAVPADLAPFLPDVLWLYQMALILNLDLRSQLGTATHPEHSGEESSSGRETHRTLAPPTRQAGAKLARGIAGSCASVAVNARKPAQLCQDKATLST